MKIQLDNEVYKVLGYKTECDCGYTITMEEFLVWPDNVDMDNIHKHALALDSENKRYNIRLTVCKCGRIYLRDIGYFTDKHNLKLKYTNNE